MRDVRKDERLQLSAERGSVAEGWGQYWNAKWQKPNWCPPPKEYKPRLGLLIS
jgi:hypothetical protein